MLNIAGKECVAMNFFFPCTQKVASPLPAPRSLPYLLKVITCFVSVFWLHLGQSLSSSRFSWCRRWRRAAFVSLLLHSPRGATPMQAVRQRVPSRVRASSCSGLGTACRYPISGRPSAHSIPWPSATSGHGGASEGWADNPVWSPFRLFRSQQGLCHPLLLRAKWVPGLLRAHRFFLSASRCCCAWRYACASSWLFSVHFQRHGCWWLPPPPVILQSSFCSLRTKKKKRRRLRTVRWVIVFLEGRVNPGLRLRARFSVAAPPRSPG